MGINRVEGAPFAQISNECLRDVRLSFRARGILAMVLSNVGEWHATREWISRQSEHEGRQAIQTALNELTALGYRRVHKECGPDGRWQTVTSWYHHPQGELAQESTEPSGELVQEPDRRVTRPSVDPTVGEPARHIEDHSKKTSKEDQTRRVRSTPPPDAFPITDDMRQWAATNTPGIDLDDETERLLDWARANGRSYKDWKAAWRNWMKNAKTRTPVTRTPPPTTVDKLTALNQRIQARRQAGVA